VLGYALSDYELFIYALQDDYPGIQMSTLIVIPQASDVATVEGDLFFRNGLRLHVLEVVRFDLTSDIKHHRIPAPELSFTRPNLPVLIEEIERLL
jgi:hypothetical protein